MTFESAKAGQLQVDQNLPLYRCAIASTSPQLAGASGGMSLKISGDLRYILADGTELLRRRGNKVAGIPAAELPATLLSRMIHGTKLALDGQPSRFWMTFRLRDEQKEKARWVPAKSSRSDILKRRALFATHAQTLTPANQIKVDAFLDLMAVVSIVEGVFTSRSPSNDPMASLGIFQWGTKKHIEAEGGSLGMFFSNLKSRAAHNIEPVAASAWAICAARGIDVRGSGRDLRITLHGNPATGAQIEVAMAAAMGEGALPAYQLLAGIDWIENFNNSVVTPGAQGKLILGGGWDNDLGAGRMKAAFIFAKRRFTLDAPNKVTRLRNLFTTQASQATGVMLGVNRPNNVPAALWRAISPSTDPKAELARLATEFLSACRAAGKLPKRGALTQHIAIEAGAQAQAGWVALQSFIWPPLVSGQIPIGDEQKLRALFEAKAMLLYSPDDARNNKREGRFATVRELLP